MIKRVGQYVGVYVGLAAIFLGSMVLVHLIPSSLLKSNIGKSVATLKKEGTYPSFGLPFRKIVQDNFTDALMLNIAYSADNNTAFKSALLNYRHLSKKGSLEQIKDLESVYLEKSVRTVGYERYWHGYLVFLRPLLVIFSYSQIRLLLFFCLFSLLAVFLRLAQKKLPLSFMLAFLLGLLLVDFFYVGMSLQFASVFLIGLVSSIYLLKYYSKKTDLYFFFFVVGGLTCFFDLLSAPMVAFGMPLLVAVNLRKPKFWQIVFYGVFWSLGYLSLWAGKWVIVQLFFSPDAISRALNQILDRTASAPDAQFSRLRALQLNFFQLVGYDKSNKIAALIGTAAYFLLWLKNATFSPLRFRKALVFIIIGLIPYLWYLVTASHAYLHVWFTYRNQFLAVVAFMLASFVFFEEEK